jgi:hypothetical protein
MATLFRNWRLRHVMLAWAAYWFTLALVVLPTPIRMARRLARLPDGHGDIAFDAGSEGFHIAMSQDGVPVWSASLHLTTLALWLAGPPLVIWAIWFVRRGQARAAPDALAHP